MPFYGLGIDILLFCSVLANSHNGPRKAGSEALSLAPHGRLLCRQIITDGAGLLAGIGFCSHPNHDRYTDCFEVSMAIPTRSCALQLACFVLLASMLAGAQAKSNQQSPDRQNQDPEHKGQQSPAPGADCSGMYSFLQDGEFVQITVEDQGRVTGFVSRYGDSEGERGAFVEHFFESGKLEGNRLAFTTRTVHGVGFEFRGTVERGEGKSRGDEAYYSLKGTLVENTTDEAKKTSSRSSQVELKSFPQDMTPPEAEKK
jgi:hypothetical protein